MRKHLIFLTFLVTTLWMPVNIMPLQADNKVAKTDISYQKFVLDNGLTLIVHEDHKAPIIAFNVWYHVGSKNERQGRTGFAHLFEHLMFNGSENYNDDYFKPMQKLGATDLNGTTNEDRTNYFENFPASALDTVLWMESDRMGHLIGAVNQARLDEQRGVVQNEKRQYDNEPYSLCEELIAKAVFPAGHPYSWTVIGSMEDLSAAKLEDVHQWFAAYYGPNNAVIAIAGDIDAKTAFEKVKQYFGDIPPGPPITKYQAWIAKRSGEQRQIAQDRVPQARLYKVWNIPQWGTTENTYLNLAAAILGSGKSSRLYKRLVYDEQIATSVSAYLDSREIAGLFFIEVDAKPGIKLAEIEKAVNEEVKHFLVAGANAIELQRVKTQYIANFIRGSERIGGFGGKSDILARNEIFSGSPDYYQTIMHDVEDTTLIKIKQSIGKWLSDGAYVLEIQPYPDLASVQGPANRQQMPEPGPAPQVNFPDFQRTTLANGLKVILAERHAIPQVRLNLVIDAGYATDSSGLPGTASLAMNMLTEGTSHRSSLQISKELALLGGRMATGSNLDTSFISLSTLKDKLDAALAIYADVILNPVFPESDFKRLQKLQIAKIQQEKSSPFSMALRVMPKLIYGDNHAYGNPFTGSGFEASIVNLTRQDLVDFKQAWIKPNNATLVIVGDTTISEIKPKLEKLFQNWKSGNLQKKNIATVPLKEKSAVYIMNKPDAPQSLVIAGHIAPSSADADHIAIETMNFILGGDFVSRINMNIREDKHWSYGAGSFLPGARGQQPFIVYAPVQADKTKETMFELKNELEDILTKKPISIDEYNNAKNSQTLQLPGQWETMAAVESSLLEMVQYSLPDDYFKTYPVKVMQLELADLNEAANKVIHPTELTWVIVGDRAMIEPRIRELGYNEINLIDSDGNIIK